MNPINLILLLLSAGSIGLCLYILVRIKHVVYLLEQPIVKKMSPEMKLKTVKVEDAEEHRRHGHRPQQGAGPGNTGNRPQQGRNDGNRDANRDGNREGNRDANRDGNRERSGHRQDGHQGQRSERGGNDHRGQDRNRDRDRGPRSDRGDRPDRGERGERPERQRPRLDVFNNERDAAPAPAESSARPEASSDTGRPALAPRRPLAATVDREEISSAPVANQPEIPADAVFVGDDNDIQHGRRSQMKKKPRFDLDEAELSAEENKIQA